MLKGMEFVKPYKAYIWHCGEAGGGGGGPALDVALELGGTMRRGEREGPGRRHRPGHGRGGGMWVVWQHGTGEVGPECG
jgi:hypothetical protein